jgi:hypothetical protein
VPGRLRAKSRPVTALRPARPAQQLDLIRLEVPQGRARRAEVIGSGPAAAVAVVDLLESLGVLPDA